MKKDDRLDVENFSNIFEKYLKEDVLNNMNTNIYNTMYVDDQGMFYPIGAIVEKGEGFKNIEHSVKRLADKINDLYFDGKIFKGFLGECLLIRLPVFDLESFMLVSYPLFHTTIEEKNEIQKKYNHGK